MPSFIIASMYLVRTRDMFEISVAEVYFLISICSLLVMPTVFIVQYLTELVRSRVTFERLNNFMSVETGLLGQRTSKYNPNLKTGEILLRNFSACWIDPEQEKRIKMIDPAKVPEVVETNPELKVTSTLKDLNIHFETGKLYIILGSVGSGKTSLINACLQELWVQNGEAFVSGKVGYVPQQSFNTNDILRNNVTYGKAFDVDLYTDTLIRCSLYDDI